jgi:hypothetical protein
MAICSICKIEKLESEFGIRKNRKKNITSMCIQCKRIYAKKWYEKNKEKAREIAKKSHFKNRENNLKRCKKWREDNILRVRKKSLQYYYKNRQQCIERVKKYREIFRDIVKKYEYEWRTKNKIYVRERARKWSKENYGKIRNYYAKRRKNLRQATPFWVDTDRIKEIYDKCYKTTLETGIQHEVDHIIPLKNPLVCGLHVPENLQIITASENSRKKNKFNL